MDRDHHRRFSPARTLLTVFVAILAAGVAAPGGATTYLRAGTPADAGDEDGHVVPVERWRSFGTRVLTGDIDGDGRDDLVIEERSGTCCGFAGSPGVVHVFFSRPDWPSTWDLAARPPDVTFGPEDEGDLLRLAALEDVSGDGQDDVVLVAISGDGPDEDRSAAGEVLVWHGRSTWPAEVSPATLAPDVIVYGDGTSNVFSAGAGDADGDGIADLLAVTAEGGVQQSVLAFFSSRGALPAVVDLAADAPDARLIGVPTGQFPVAFGDVSGDGIVDVVFGGESSISEALIFLGADPWEAVRDHGVTGADREIPLDGGRQPVVIADVVGDATPDLVLSEVLRGDATRGRVHVYRGSATIATDSAAAVIRGRDAADALAVHAVGDVTDDGLPDLVLGATGDGARQRNFNWGEIVLLRGPPGDLDLSTAAGDAVIFGTGRVPNGSAILDLNHDGATDLVLGRTTENQLHVFLGPLNLADTPPAPTLHVDAALGADSEDGLAWDTAKATIEGALIPLDSIPGPVTVRVAEGTYAETFTVGEDTVLSGGWPSGGGRRRDPVAHPTVIDAEGRDATVRVVGNVGAPASRIDGFVITGGEWDRGAGILVNTGTAVITNNVITGNTALAVGYTYFMSCQDALGNPQSWEACAYPCSGYGTGIFVEAGADAVITNNLVHDNGVDFDFPFCMGPPPPDWFCFGYPQDCRFSDHGTGGGIRTDSSDTIIRNNTVTRDEGQGIRSDALPTVENNVVHANGSTDIVLPREATASGNVYGTSWNTLDATNVEADPLFVDPAVGDFHLSHLAAGQAADSPAIDAGTVAASAACLEPAPCLDGFTTRTDAVTDAGTVDAGFHYFLIAPNQPPTFGGVADARGTEDCAIELTWLAATDPEDDDPILYRVYRADAPGGQDFGMPLATTGNTFHRDEAVVFGQTYHYVVRALDGIGAEDDNGVELAATPRDLSPPLAAWDALPVAAGCELTLSVAVEDDCSGIALTELHRSTTPGFVPGAATLVATDPPAMHADTVPTNGNYYYRLVATNGAGIVTVTAQLSARVDACDAVPTVPGEAFIPLVQREASGIRLDVVPAPGADFHRLYRGTLAALGSYDHGVSLGADRTLGGGDDLGLCDFAGPSVVDERGLEAGSFYFLVVGVNAAGEGLHGMDSSGFNGADATSGPTDCTP